MSRHPISETSSRNANRAYNPLQQTASMTPPPPYVPLPPAGTADPGVNYVHLQAPGIYSGPHPRRYSHLLLPDHATPTSRIHPPAMPIQQQEFGAVQIAASLPLLPDPRALSSGAAAARARWRFVSTVMVVLGIYLFVGAVVGLELLGEMAGS